MFYPYRAICYASMETAAANARYDDIHKDEPFHDGTFENWSAKRTHAFPYHARDGVVIGASTTNLNPDDAFLKTKSDDNRGEEVGGGDTT